MDKYSFWFVSQGLVIQITKIEEKDRIHPAWQVLV
jgi:hypothetical protein